ncbi:MAG: LytR C-terminal domain-containing protein [Gemmatimonadota bacterium]
MPSRRPDVRARSDRWLTLVIVVLALAVGAFLSSLVYRWTGSPPGPAGNGPSGAGPRTAERPGPDRSRIRVEVLNGTRVPGLADRVTELLRREGFDVVNYGNASRRPQPSTSILARVGDGAFAREVALALPGTPIRRELAPDGFVDVTVLVGGDYPRFFAEAHRDRAPAGLLSRIATWLRARFDGGREAAPPEGARREGAERGLPGWHGAAIISPFFDPRVHTAPRTLHARTRMASKKSSKSGGSRDTPAGRRASGKARQGARKPAASKARSGSSGSSAKPAKTKSAKARTPAKRDAGAKAAKPARRAAADGSAARTGDRRARGGAPSRRGGETAKAGAARGAPSPRPARRSGGDDAASSRSGPARAAGRKGLTATEERHYRGKLLATREAILKNLEELREELRGLQEPSHELEEWAQEEKERDILILQEQRQEEELSRVQVGLQRIEQGSYGQCARCGRRISKERLEEVPTAVFCRHCQP